MATAHSQSFRATDPIRAEIHAQIEALNRNFRHLSLNEIGWRADALRRLGQASGLDAVCCIAGGLSDAIARDGRSAIVPVYLESLTEAACCDSRDRGASQVFLAFISGRLAG